MNYYEYTCYCYDNFPSPLISEDTDFYAKT